MSDSTKIVFKATSSDEFHKRLKERIEKYFHENLLSKSGNIQLWVKSIALLSLTVSTYAVLIFTKYSLTVGLLLCMLLGLLKGSIGFIICHDALHNSFSSQGKINKLLGYLFDVMGMSSTVWRITHNYQHHIYTNIHGKDHDIDKAILLRFSPQDKLYSFHRYQHWYIFFLYFFTALNWIFYADYRFLYLKRKSLKGFEIGLALLLKSLNLMIFLGVPLYLIPLPSWQILVGYLVAVMLGGFYIAIVFQLAHLVENVAFPLPDEKGVMDHSWGIHEILTTSNFATNSYWTTFFLGGLNFQIEHHLFANISHVHYPVLSKIVKSTTQEFGLPYHEQPTLRQAIKSHFITVKALGRCQRIND